MSFTPNHHDAVPDATPSYVSDTTTSIYSGVSNLTDHSNSRASRTSNKFNDSSSLRRDREREGRCADCGAQTHEERYEPGTGSSRKVPLNIEGEVHRGRCLLCNPLPVRLSMQQQQLQQQQLQQQQMISMDDMESVHSNGSSIAQQHHPQDGRSYWGALPEASHSSAGQSLDGERRHHHHQRRGGRSDMSVTSAQSYNSAPVYGQHSNSSNTYPLAAHSASNINLGAAPPPIEEFSVHQSRGGRSQQQQEQHYQNRNAASSNNSIASNLNNLALNEHQGQAQSHEFSAPTRRTTPQQQQQQPAQQQSNNDAAASIHEILSDMQRYPNHTPTQSKVLHSLWVLSWDNVNAATIGRLGGIPLLLDSMRLHSNTMTLQSNGVAALQNLAMNCQNRDIITESDGVAVIVEVMAQFLEDKAIQQSGCTALANLANGSDEQKSHVAESGGILAMMRAVDTHRGDESILRAAYQALRKLGYNPGS